MPGFFYLESRFQLNSGEQLAIYATEKGVSQQILTKDVGEGRHFAKRFWNCSNSACGARTIGTTWLRRQAHHHAEAQAMALTQRAKEILALNDQDLTGGRRVDAQMLERCAWAITRSTTASQAWITHKLGTRSAANVSQQIRRFDSNRDRQIDARIESWIDFVNIC